MTHNEDKNQLIETDLEITVVGIIFCLFKKIEERAMAVVGKPRLEPHVACEPWFAHHWAMGYDKKIQIKYLYMKTIMSWINIIHLNGINRRLNVDSNELEYKAIETKYNTERKKIERKMNRTSMNFGNFQVTKYIST